MLFVSGGIGRRATIGESVGESAEPSTVSKLLAASGTSMRMVAE